MREARGDLWKVEADARVITTNGFVTSRNENVMGTGCAKEAKERWPQLPTLLAERLRATGNHVYVFHPQDLDPQPAFDLVTYPVKPVMTDDGQPGFRAKGDPKLIRRGAAQLVALANAFGWQQVALPRPGCGSGGLDWRQVRPWLEDLLDDRFVVVTF